MADIGHGGDGSLDFTFVRSSMTGAEVGTLISAGEARGKISKHSGDCRTPVVRINRLAPPDVNLFAKIEAFNPLGSVKDRLALGVIEAAEKSGDLKPGQTVIEATSGNTGIGLAMVCAAKGYPLVVTMAEQFSVERRRLMRFLGAKVVLTRRQDAALAWWSRRSSSPRRTAGS